MKNSHKNAKKLLLIDDDPNLVLLVKDYLEFRGYQVLTADNGKEALNILETEIPDMIICDIMMPEMDGLTLVKKIRDNSKIRAIPVMVLSAKGQTQDRIEALNSGANAVMNKPFEPEELVAQIKANLKYKDIRQEELPRGDEHELDLPIKVPHPVNITFTEQKVIRLLARGMANQEIAENLNVSKRTIESHVSNMLNKTSLNNRTELARWALENHLA